MSGPKSTGAYGFGAFVPAAPLRDNSTPLHRGVAPIAEDMLAKVCRDARAIRQRGDLDAWLENRRIGPPLNPVPTRGERITGYVATALALFILVYFGAQLLRGWLA